jgi:hypothetical protein
MSQARIAAVLLTWVYAAGFGISTIPVAVYLAQRGTLPTFFGLFEMYGGPWSSRFSHRTFVWLLIAFLIVAVAVAGRRGSCGRGRESGAFSPCSFFRSRLCSGSASPCRSHGYSAPCGQSSWFSRGDRCIELRHLMCSLRQESVTIA